MRDIPGPVAAPAVPLADVIVRYLNRLTKKDVPDRQIDEVRFVLQTLLLGVVGNKPVCDVDQTDADAVVQALLQYPANARKKQEFNGLTVRQAIELAASLGSPTLSTQTAEKYLGRIRALFFDADTRRFLAGDDPFFHTKIVRGRQKTTTEPFSDTDLRRIFDPVLRRTACSGEPHKFWTPLLLLYGQMEVIEVAQLMTDDIQCVDNIWAFRIIERPAHPATVRPASSHMMPIHPMLLDLGFLDYVEDLRCRNVEQLFPTLPSSRHHGRAAGIAAWFNNRFLRPARSEAGQARRAGIAAPNKSLSSLRLLAELRFGQIARPACGLEELARILATLTFDLPTLERYRKGQFDDYFAAFLHNRPAQATS